MFHIHSITSDECYNIIKSSLNKYHLTNQSYLKAFSSQCNNSNKTKPLYSTGCISYLVLNNDKIDIGSEIYEVVQVRECPVCEKRPCQNGGVCVTSNTAQGYMCECLNGYSGDTCEIFQTETSWGNIPMNGNNGYPGFVDPSVSCLSFFRLKMF